MAHLSPLYETDAEGNIQCKIDAGKKWCETHRCAVTKQGDKWYCPMDPRNANKRNRADKARSFAASGTDEVHGTEIVESQGWVKVATDPDQQYKTGQYESFRRMGMSHLEAKEAAGL